MSKVMKSIRIDEDLAVKADQVCKAWHSGNFSGMCETLIANEVEKFTPDDRNVNIVVQFRFSDKARKDALCAGKTLPRKCQDVLTVKELPTAIQNAERGVRFNYDEKTVIVEIDRESEIYKSKRDFDKFEINRFGAYIEFDDYPELSEICAALERMNTVLTDDQIAFNKQSEAAWKEAKEKEKEREQKDKKEKEKRIEQKEKMLAEFVEHEGSEYLKNLKSEGFAWANTARDAFAASLFGLEESDSGIERHEISSPDPELLEKYIAAKNQVVSCEKPENFAVDEISLLMMEDGDGEEWAEIKIEYMLFGFEYCFYSKL